MPAKLKLFRTAIGFYDAYVAAPSRKAALQAWGSQKNLFASGRAELVEDPGVAPEALADPGKVIRIRRGTDAENIAALPIGQSARARRPSRQPAAAAPPRPSRAALEEAEEALRAAEQKRADQLARLDEQIRKLEKKRSEEATRINDLIDECRRQYEDQAERYNSAMEAWRNRR